MRIAITGGTGFVGTHVARTLRAEGHDCVLIARDVDPEMNPPGARFVAASVTDEEALVAAFAGCNAVIHCAGINREIGTQTYEAIHVHGTRNVVSAAKRAGVERVALLSYLRARADCGSDYLESKWTAEEILRSSGLRFLVLKAGMIFGSGDHMLDHTAKSIGTFRIFTRVGLRDRPVRPVAVQDVVSILRAFALEGALQDTTVAVLGPERLPLSVAARRIADVMGVRALIVPMPIALLYVLAWMTERLMKVPLVSIAQVRLLREGPEPGPMAAEPPPELQPRMSFNPDVIRQGLPARRRYGLDDLRKVPPSRIVLATAIAAPPERCKSLSLNVDVHLSVPGARERVVDGVSTGVMTLGDHVTWESRRFGLPVRMTSKITELSDAHFVDEMLRGPFARWRHVHRFDKVPSGTSMTDEIEYALPLGPFGWIADRLFVRRYMTRLISDQNAFIRRLAEERAEGGGA